jgi:hypothetical protein
MERFSNKEHLVSELGCSNLFFINVELQQILMQCLEKLFSPPGEPRHLSIIPIIKRHVY